MSTTRITICIDSGLHELAESVTAEHYPYLRRHRILRLAIRQGLQAFTADPQLVSRAFAEELSELNQRLVAAAQVRSGDPLNDS